MEYHIQDTKNAVLKVEGANCTSCSIAIEHMGEKLPSIEDIWVDRKEGRVHIDYDGNEEALIQVCEFIGRLGYKAEILEK